MFVFLRNLDWPNGPPPDCALVTINWLEGNTETDRDREELKDKNRENTEPDVGTNTTTHVTQRER